MLLDESSQLTEPGSLLPLHRVSCERLLAVGDPMQLPPALHNRTARGRSAIDAGGIGAGVIDAPAAPEAASGFDLTLTLFQRLARGGVAPVLLRAQYRCHPAISSLASRLFYDNRLVDGLGGAAHSARAPCAMADRTQRP